MRSDVGGGASICCPPFVSSYGLPAKRSKCLGRRASPPEPHQSPPLHCTFSLHSQCPVSPAPLSQVLQQFFLKHDCDHFKQSGESLVGYTKLSCGPPTFAALSTLVSVQICKALIHSLYTDPLSFNIGESCGGHSRIPSGVPRERAECRVALWTCLWSRLVCVMHLSGTDLFLLFYQ